MTALTIGVVYRRERMPHILFDAAAVVAVAIVALAAAHLLLDAAVRVAAAAVAVDRRARTLSVCGTTGQLTTTQMSQCATKATASHVVMRTRLASLLMVRTRRVPIWPPASVTIMAHLSPLRLVRHCSEELMAVVESRVSLALRMRLCVKRTQSATVRRVAVQTPPLPWAMYVLRLQPPTLAPR